MVSMGAIQVIAAVFALVSDMSKSGPHAPEILGALTGSLVITLGLGWVWRKIYISGKKEPSLPKPRE